MYVCLYTIHNTHVYLYTCMCVCTYVCVSAQCLYTCLYVCTYVSLLHMKSDPYDMPPTNRSCGGQHTMTYAHRRTRISALRLVF